MSAIRLSVVMPVLDRAGLVGRALDSLLAQTLTPLEILVVDGGSTDGTQDVVRSYPEARLVQLDGAGVPAAHNHGIGLATGDAVAFCASDDILEPSAFELHAAALDSRTECGMSVGLTAFFADDPHPLARGGVDGTVRRVRALESVVVRSSVIAVCGGFDETLGPSADLEWISRLSDSGVDVAFIDAVTVHKRIHAGNTTYRRQQTSAEVLAALAAVVRRRNLEPPTGDR